MDFERMLYFWDQATSDERAYERDKLVISENGCQMLIARLYQMCFEYPWHFLWKRYTIPINWKWVESNTGPFLKFVLVPP